MFFAFSIHENGHIACECGGELMDLILTGVLFCSLCEKEFNG
jgi:hypothetical protein